MLSVIEVGFIGKNVFCQLPEDILIAVYKRASPLLGKLQAFLHFHVKAFQNLLLHVFHARGYISFQFLLQLFKRRADFGFGAAFLVNQPYAFFKVHAVDLAKDFVGSAEHLAEQLEFVVKQAENAHIGIISLIDEVDDDNVALLPVAVAAAYALLDPLRIPGQVVIHDKRAELKVKALGGGFRSDHDFRRVPEIVNDGGAAVCRPDAACPACAGF